MKDDATDAIISATAMLLSFVFLALQMHFYGEGDQHMGVLMCGLCLACGGTVAGWSLAGRRRR